MSGGRMRGPITEIAGWGCAMPELSGIVFYEFEHSMCEMHERKTPQLSST